MWSDGRPRPSGINLIYVERRRPRPSKANLRDNNRRPMKTRIQEVDALRGMMLVWMTFTHLPTVLSAYVNQPLGYFAATEGFIFLSALFTGRICSRVADHDGNPAMCLS